MPSTYLSSHAQRFIAFAFALAATFLWGQPDAGLHGPVSLIQADPHHTNTLLAGTATAHLFRSRDGGITWSPVPFPAEQRSNLHAMLIDPDRENVYWIGVSSEKPQFAGAFRSVDEGATWQPVPGLEQKQVWSMALWKVDPHVIAARNGRRRLSVAQWRRRLDASLFARRSSTASRGFPRHRSRRRQESCTPARPTSHGRQWMAAARGSPCRGMQEDSDIFSLDVNVKRRSHFFAGACSGVTEASMAGARGRAGTRTGRTVSHIRGQVAPNRPEVVYAGTNLGLMIRETAALTGFGSPTSGRVR